MKFPKISLDPLSNGFVLYKPLQQDPKHEKEVYRLDKEQKLLASRKRDGWRLFTVKTKNGWKIYTDNIRDVTSHLPHLRDDLNQYAHFKNLTMLAGEGIIDENGNDNFEQVGRILNSSPEHAIEIQKDIGHLRFMIFDIPFKNNICLLGRPFIERLGYISILLGRFHMPLEMLIGSIDNIKKFAIKKQWEGLVFYSGDFKGDYRVDGGAHPRPNDCYKWKPVFEDDFIVRKWIATPDNPRRLKEIVISQIDPLTHKEVEYGKHGTFKKSVRNRLLDILTDKSNGQVAVVQMEFDKRFPSGKLRNKRFVRIREDKKPEHCVAPQSYIF